ncbi:MAG: DUF5794 domain-containing protein [Halobacteriaceae archaeon]
MSKDAAPAQSLAVVMGLPLADGVFATLVLAGTLDTAVGVVQTGLLVFGGAATAALLLASDRSRPADGRRLLRIGVPLVTVAAAEAALAGTFVSVVDTATFRPFAGLVLVAVAARVASAHVTRYLPGPGIVVAVGAVLSFDPNGPVAIAPDATAALHAVAAAGIGVAFGLGVVAARPHLRRILDAERFRFGSAVALGTMGASVAGLVPSGSPLPLVALALAAVLAFDPNREDVDAGTDSGEDAPTR